MSAVYITTNRYLMSLEDADMEKELLKPLIHFTSSPRNKIRQNLIQVLGHWKPVAEEKVKFIEELIYCLHHAILMQDDMLDSSVLRQGIPTAYTVWGIPRTVIAVKMLLRRCYDLLHQLQDDELAKTCNNDYSQILAGQGMEVYWRDNFICPTQEDYIQMIYRKSSLPFILVLDLINAFTTAKNIDLRKFLIIFGIYFQIHDDFQNLQSQFYYNNKGFCEDITEGKFSFPIVHAINNFPNEEKVIKDILRERTHDVERKRELLSILEKCGSFEYTKKVLKELKSAIYTETAKLGDNPFIEDFVEKIIFTLA